MAFFDLFTFDRPQCSFTWCKAKSEEVYVGCEAGHSMEWSCFQGYLTTQLERQATHIVCPIDGCYAEILATDLLPLLSRRESELPSRSAAAPERRSQTETSSARPRYEEARTRKLSARAATTSWRLA